MFQFQFSWERLQRFWQSLPRVKADIGRLSAERKLLIGYTFAITLVIAQALVAHHALTLSEAGTHKALQSTSIIRLAELLKDEVQDAVAAQGEFLLVGDERVLVPYTSNIEELPRTVNKLRSILGGHREQLARLDDIQNLFAKWRTEVAEPEIAARRAAPEHLMAVAAAAHAIAVQLQRDAHAVGPPDLVRWAQSIAALKGQINVALVLSRTPAERDAWKSILLLANRMAAPTLETGRLADRLEVSLRDTADAAGLARNDITRIVSGRIGTDIDALRRAAAASTEHEAGDLQALLGQVDDALIWARGVIIVGSLLLVALLLSAMIDFRVLSGRVQSQSREMALLNQLGELLHACGTFDEALVVIERFARLLFPQQVGAVYLISPSRDLAECVVTWGEGGSTTAAFTPDQCWAIRRGQVHLVDETGAGMACKHLSDVGPHAYMCLPLVAQNEMLGILTLITVGDVNHHGPGLRSQNRLVGTFAEQIGSAVSNLRLRETLRNQSIRDPLTGLFNRRYLEETLERELRRAERHHSSVGVVMFDIDHFKQFNDSFGHDGGDALLRELGKVLQTAIRREDIACRYGGEEFVVVLPDASFEDTVARAEQLQEQARGLSVIHRGMSLGHVTLSLGVALFPDRGKTTDEMLRAADTALYRAKQNGRARIEVA